MNMKAQNVKNQARQGDVLITKITTMPKATPLKKSARGWVLAEGEATGHAHAISGKQTSHCNMFSVDGFSGVNAREILEVKPGKSVTLTHEEHGPMVLGEGLYEIRHQREYHPEEIRAVVD